MPSVDVSAVSTIIHFDENELAADVPAAWWCRLRKNDLQRTLWRGSASSGQSVPPLSSTLTPGDVPGTFGAPLPPLSAEVRLICMTVVQALLSRLLRFQVVPHKLVHTVDELTGFPDPQLSAEHGDRRRHPRALVVRQYDKRQHVVPMVRVPIDNDGQHVEERLVEPLRLSIPLRVVWRVSCLPDVEQAGAKVRDVLLHQQLGKGTGFHVREGECGRPLGEAIRQYKDVPMMWRITLVRRSPHLKWTAGLRTLSGSPPALIGSCHSDPAHWEAFSIAFLTRLWATTCRWVWSAPVVPHEVSLKQNLMGKPLCPQNGMLNNHQSPKYDLRDTRFRDLQFVPACGVQLNRGVNADPVPTSMLHRRPVRVSIPGDRMTTTGKVQAVLLTLDVR
ncbi:hypothetical protein T12_7174 [Trichinella patagoniensis]|uniref:Uncharacterized protein n=1 Tax=Trichinella patagoniensis TaxID=990121 RepID=A0A0V1AE31_9BILA|nr:hypothetical protein T12_7174 [Trichinella patagoniensis]